jgi:hypothetical protein
MNAAPMSDVTWTKPVHAGRQQVDVALLNPPKHVTRVSCAIGMVVATALVKPVVHSKTGPAVSPMDVFGMVMDALLSNLYVPTSLIRPLAQHFPVDGTIGNVTMRFLQTPGC